MSVQLTICPDAETTAQAAMEQIEAWAGEAIDEQARFVIALAGGSTPRRVYELWAASSKLDWSLVDLLFGDERCVPPDHPDSNYGMVRETLLGNIARPPRAHRMLGEHADPEYAAAQYERTLAKLVDEEEGVDVVLLGMGPDGHTASLFPDSALLDESERRVVATTSPDGQTRLTLTLAELRRAQRIMFLVVGADKAAIVKEVLEGEVDPLRLPAQALLRDNELETHLFLDEAAASQLEEDTGG